MMRRNVRDRAVCVSLFAVGLAWISPGCMVAEERGTPCSTAAECDDGSPCTSDACTGDRCVSTPLPDGPGALPQIERDCARNECRAGLRVSVDDPGDVASDGDDCTVDRCINGVSSHLPEPEGASCSSEIGEGICHAGLCEPPVCGFHSFCDDGNPCTADACNPAGTMCVAVPIDGVPTPAKPQNPGDCRQRRCVNGNDTQVADDADLPDDGNPCSADLCVDGEPKHPFLPAGSPCGEGLVCSAVGQCGS